MVPSTWGKKITVNKQTFGCVEAATDGSVDSDPHPGSEGSSGLSHCGFSNSPEAKAAPRSAVASKRVVIKCHEGDGGVPQQHPESSPSQA